MTGPSDASTQATPTAIPIVQHRVILAENVPLDDPQLRSNITGDAFAVLARWLKDLIGVDIAPDTLKNLLANLPVMGSVFSAFDVVDDIKNLATYNQGVRKWGYETMPPWIETGLDVIGILPLPPFKQASMGLKTAIKMAFDPKFVFAHAKGNAASMITGSTIDLLEDVANQHLQAWQPKIIQGVDQVIGGTIKTVDVIARMPQARAISSVYTFVTRKKDPAEEIKDLLNDVNKAGQGRIKDVIEMLIPLILTFVKQHKAPHVSVPKLDLAKIKRKAETESHTKRRNAAPHQVNEHEIAQTPGVTTKARTNGQQNSTAAPDCKSCKTANPVNLATGEEILYQTDFASPGLMPVSWTRCYRSSHAPYDQGLLGARWTSAYTTAITQTAQGLVYHDATGRNVKLPALDVGQAFDHHFEAFTIHRTSAMELTIVYAGGSADVFRADGQPARDALGQQSVRYALRLKRTSAGPTLFILPANEARTQFRDHPTAKLLSRDGLLVITDGHQLWLECRPANADSFATQSPAALHAVSHLAALHDANQKAGIATIVGDADLQPAAYSAQLSHCIGYVDQLLSDGSRHTHVRYRYSPAIDERGIPLGAHAGLDLVEQLDAEDQARGYAYASHLLTRYTDYNGFGQNLTWKHELTWAPFPVRCIRTVADDGTEDTRLSYDTWFNETTLIDAAGTKSVFTYNADNLVTGIATQAADGSQPYQQRVWDKHGNLLKEIDPEGRTTRYAYDDKGNLLSVISPVGATTRYEYDPNGSPVKVIDPAGRSVKRSFDAKGNLVQQIDPAGRITAYTYNDLGQLVSVQDAKGGKKQLSYNDFGQLIAYTDCSGKTTRYSYNQLGHLIASTDAAGHVTRYDTDRLGRVLRATYPDGTHEQYQYDANDNLTTFTDAKGKSTRYRYNGQGLLTGRQDANGYGLAYKYTANLQLLQLINQNGDRYDFRYDAQGRLTQETGFDGKQTHYRYDAAGHLIESSSGKTITEYERDDDGKLLVKRIHRHTGGGPVTHITRYQYDVLGNLLAVHGDDSTLQFGYDDASNLVEETQHVTLRHGDRNIERVFTLRHEVDELGNRIETVLPNGRKVTTQRYGSGHWIGTLWNGSPVADIERDDLHREKERQLGRLIAQRKDRLVQTRRYDALSRLRSLTLASRHGNIAARRFGYDDIGNLTQVHDLHRERISYEYDQVGQLLKATQPDLTETFAFDPAGNLTDGSTPKTQLANTAGKDHTQWEQGLDHLSEQPQAESRPALALVTRNLLKQYLGMQFDHDAEGNTIKKIYKGKDNEQPYSLTLHYDAENRLIKAVKPQGQQTVEAQYRYDAFSRRIAKVVSTLQQAQATGTHGVSPQMETVREDITFFVWDGDTLIQEVQPDHTITYLYEPDSFVPLAQVHSDIPESAYDPAEVKKAQEREEQSQVQLAAETEKLAWLKVTDKTAHDFTVKEIEQRKEKERQEHFRQLEAQAQGDRIFYLNTDQLGTPQEAVSEDGKVVWLARYKAWGRVHALDKAEVRQPLRFQGQYEDEETGLYYNRYRYYDPDTARYLTQDPIGLLGGENSFQFAPNPTGWIDPRGLARVGGKGANGTGTKKSGAAICPTQCKNPCAGRDPAAAARKWQGPGNDPYLGVDSYTNTVVKKGTVLYTLYPHGNQPGNYFAKSPAVLQAGTARDFNDAVQVAHKGNWNGPNARDMRTKLHAYVVGKDTCMAVGQAQNNPNLGKGGGTQYFIENRDKGNLIDTGRIIGLAK